VTLWLGIIHKRRPQSEGRGSCPVRTFCGQKGREVNFSRFCADVFYGRPLNVSVFVFCRFSVPFRNDLLILYWLLNLFCTQIVS